MEMCNICVIGAGNLGIRHYQALLNIDFYAHIFVVDPSSSALIRAKNDFPVNNKYVGAVEFYESIRYLPDEIDLCIIATNSDVRAGVTYELLESKKINNILFEKVLFQQDEDYININKKIESGNVKAWVNCPRRVYPYYQEIKRQLNQSKHSVNYLVTGGIWGLACNSIHYIDHMEWITGESLVDVYTDNLDKQIYKSKREGFIEISGELQCRFDGGSLLTLKSIQSESNQYLIYIDNSEYAFELDEFENICKLKHHDDVCKVPIRPLYQSEITNAIARDIINQGYCELVSYGQSMRQHLNFTRAIRKYVQNMDASYVTDGKLTIT